MDFKFPEKEFESHKAKITVVGTGGAGNNTVNTLFRKKINGSYIVALNTDAKHLEGTKADKKILIGQSLTKGLGAGGYPEKGRDAAIESKEEIKNAIQGSDMVFITCGLGGGTGTGSAPVVAKIAKDAGAIVIAAVTLPFKLEGARMSKAEDGLIFLREVCDTVIVIENQTLLEHAGNMPLKKAFQVADQLISTMIKGITETIHQPSLVNLDFADVKAVMTAGGVASIGVGESNSDEERAREAITSAMNNKLLNVDYSGAKGALVQIIGGEDMTLEEISYIGETVQKELDPSAQVIWGARILPSYKGKIQVITILTGVTSPFILGPTKKDKTEYGIEMIDTNHTPIKEVGGFK